MERGGVQAFHTSLSPISAVNQTAAISFTAALWSCETENEGRQLVPSEHRNAKDGFTKVLENQPHRSPWGIRGEGSQTAVVVFLLILDLLRCGEMDRMQKAKREFKRQGVRVCVEDVKRIRICELPFPAPHPVKLDIRQNGPAFY